ncbi:DNA translocase FtsK [Rhizobium sp. L1K21]|uniref:FtsK/SpoIIIE family DNA translocase n=1 Tax=Rhizobium sp. L1K21 TaxID=2954933 RepID=UPI00209242E0|nr:DNA translocase FtsK [Rhizobium sp. L1K21]MCO6188035.1 DNA translocase FtsK [Rhizobium sp. L1K21]
MARGSQTTFDNGKSSSGLGAFIWRQAASLMGLAIFLSLALAVVALSTWNVSDPSLSYANGGEPSNLLGYPGAIFSDLAMQFFGLGAVVALLPILALALALIFHKPITRLPQRAVAWFAGSVMASTALGCFPSPITWPLPNGIGGVSGDMILRLPALFLGAYPSGIGGMIAGSIIAVPAAWVLAFASGLIQGEPVQPKAKPSPAQRRAPEPQIEDDDDDSFSPFEVAFGAAAHGWYTLQGHVRRLTGMRERHDEDDDFEAPYDFNEEEFDGAMPYSARQYDTEPGQRVEPDLYENKAPAASAGRREPSFFEDDEDDDLPFDLDMPRPAGILPDPRPAAPQPSARVAAPHPAPTPAPARPRAPPAARAPMRASPTRMPGSDGFHLPPMDLLAQPQASGRDPTLSPEALEQNARILEGVLEDFGVKGEIIHVRPGPVVTLYELEPAPGIKSSRVIGLADDIARSMSAIAARVAVVQGRNAIGIELPNQKRETVYLREIIENRDFEGSKAKLAMALGKTIGGEPVVADLAKMPHLLVAGTTGSGKSVAINTMILSLVYRLSPEKCRLIMIDPKMLELSIYDGIPHLLSPVVTDPKKAVVALKWTVREMEDRYKKMSKIGVRNIDGFNARVEQALANGEAITRTVQTGFDRETGEAIYETEEFDLKPLPYIVVIIDEMADLMMVAGKDIEGAVQRLAQMARAAGIHVIMATQRPSVDVITGTIKANFPTRISFQVTSKIDSRTILGEQGAEQLLGMGDMLYMAGGGRIQRVHGPFVSDKEVEDIVSYLKTQGVPEYLDAITEDDDEDGEGGGGPAGTSNLEGSDDPYDQAVAIVLRDGKASTSYIQRRLGIGYNRAATLIERMEQEGVIGPANHAGKREILVPTERDIIGD